MPLYPMPLYPNELPDSVRRQLFWIIKRHSSYTAWQRAFAAFDRLFRKMESLLPELASKPFGTYGVGLPPHTKPFSVWPNWDLKQSWHRDFRIALARLRKGDKHVLGLLPPRPVLGGMLGRMTSLLLFFLGEHPMDGYHKDYDLLVPEKSALTMLAWEAYNRVYENIKLTQSRYPPYRIEIDLIYSPDDMTLETSLPDMPGVNSRDFLDMLTRYPIPADLPPVPEPVMLPSEAPPWWAPEKQKGGPLVFQSGERVFRPGIYLSDPYAMLHYIHMGSPAPVLNPGHQKPDLDCAWSLIWPDERYANGADIPEEESLYFPDETKPREPAGSHAHPGDRCPRTGMWNAPNLPNVHKYIRRGEPMPGPETSVYGSVIWHWLQEEPYPEKR